MCLRPRPCPPQNHFRSAVTDEYLRVKGSNGSIFALGDAATIEQNTVSNLDGQPVVRTAAIPPFNRQQLSVWDQRS